MRTLLEALTDAEKTMAAEKEAWEKDARAVLARIAAAQAHFSTLTGRARKALRKGDEPFEEAQVAQQQAQLLRDNARAVLDELLPQAHADFWPHRLEELQHEAKDAWQRDLEAERDRLKAEIMDLGKADAEQYPMLAGQLEQIAAALANPGYTLIPLGPFTRQARGVKLSGEDLKAALTTPATFEGPVWVALRLARFGAEAPQLAGAGEVTVYSGIAGRLGDLGLGVNDANGPLLLVDPSGQQVRSAA